jgi:signal transduction histidine kinase
MVGGDRSPFVATDRDDLGAQYSAERGLLTHGRLRAACVLGMGFVPVYAVTDYLLYPGFFLPLLELRSMSVALCVGIWMLSQTRVSVRFPDLLGLLLGGGLMLMLCGMPVLLLGYATPYFAGFLLAVFGIALLMPLRLAYCAALTSGLLVLYVLMSVLHGSIDNWAAFGCNTSCVAASIVIALVGLQTEERLRRAEFRARVALEDAYEAKTNLVAALADKSAKLESLNQEMEDLLYVASHDLRAPLINAQGFSRELQVGVEQLRSHNGKAPEVKAALADVDESLQFILTAVARMDVLISSLLNVSRVATRTNPTEQVDLNALVRKLAESFHYQLAEKGITLAIDPLPSVTGDTVRLGQLFGNLIDNAIKYMASRGERRIHVGVRADSSEPRFFVRDTGPGIPKAQHDQVFRLFRRLTNGDCPGEGIGLTMVRKIVEKHGGRIWVESEPPAGTTFWFTLRNAVPTLETR